MTVPAVTMAEALDRVDVREWVGPKEAMVSRVDHDSRDARPGSLFCCIPGAGADGHDFAPEAIARGAVGLVVERPLPLDAARPAVPQAVVASVREAIGPVAARVSGDPSLHLDVVGVTGTNGKTTVTHLLGSILDAAGRPTRVLGTLTGARTTPEAPDLQRRLAEAREAGARSVAMEVSSHALDMHRVDGTRFAVAVFTNLSRDHLDHHGTMESYFAAKARLFDPSFAATAVVNLDDPHGRLLRDAALVPTVGYSLDDLGSIDVGLRSSSFRWRGHDVVLHLGGRFNVANALAAAEAAVALGVPTDAIADGLGRPVSIPGRFEQVDRGQPFDVIVDFAHTPDGLDNLLAAAGEGGRRVIVTFGCGGDRDVTKRGPMGAAAARGADVVVITADNSRGEPTADIVAAIERGATDEPRARVADLRTVTDRRAAIAAALGAARPGDVVVVAGKGHEATQTLGTEVHEFDDRVVVAEELAALGHRGAAAGGPT